VFEKKSRNSEGMSTNTLNKRFASALVAIEYFSSVILYRLNAVGLYVPGRSASPRRVLCINSTLPIRNCAQEESHIGHMIRSMDTPQPAA
jgi:hypothetical protein